MILSRRAIVIARMLMGAGIALILLRVFLQERLVADPYQMVTGGALALAGMIWASQARRACRAAQAPSRKSRPISE